MMLAACGPRQSQCRTCRGQDSALDDVLKFTNVAWPRISFQGVNHLLGDFLNRLALTLGELADEVAGEEGDVLGAFA